MRVQLRRLARDDIQSAVAWYTERDPEVGGAFVDEVDRVLERISGRAEQFPAVHRGIRRALLKQFPYAIYFRVHEASITVLAVPHQRRAPGIWSRA